MSDRLRRKLRPAETNDHHDTDDADRHWAGVDVRMDTDRFRAHLVDASLRPA